MTTRELRIGNIVQGMQVTVVKSLSEREINGWNCGSFSGIPLTEEILLKCGFEKKLEEKIFNRHDICLSYSGEYYWLYVNREYEVGKEFKYLHRLQNLYFALTGEELGVVL